MPSSSGSQQTSAAHMRKLAVGTIAGMFLVSVFTSVLLVLITQSQTEASVRSDAFVYLVDTIGTVKASLEEEKETLKLVSAYDETKTWYENSKKLTAAQEESDAAFTKVLTSYDILKKNHNVNSRSPYEVLELSGIMYQRTQLQKRDANIDEVTKAFRIFRESAASLALFSTNEILAELQGTVTRSLALSHLASAVLFEAVEAGNVIKTPNQKHLEEYISQKAAVDIRIRSELDAASFGLVSDAVFNAAREETSDLRHVHEDISARFKHISGSVSTEAEATALRTTAEELEHALVDIFNFVQEAPEEQDNIILVDIVCLGIILVCVVLIVGLLLWHWNTLESQSYEEKMDRYRAVTMKRAVARMERFIFKLCRLDLGKEVFMRNLGVGQTQVTQQPQEKEAAHEKASEFLVSELDGLEDDFDDDPMLAEDGEGGAPPVPGSEGAKQATAAEGSDEDFDEVVNGRTAEEGGPGGDEGVQGMPANSDFTHLEGELYKLEHPARALTKFLHPFVVERYRRNNKTTGRAVFSQGDLGDKLAVYDGTVLFISLAGLQRRATSDSVKALPVRFSRILESVYRAAAEFGGTVHTVSEVLVITFNVVHANEDPARAACSCALNLTVQLKDEEYVRCAVASGSVAAGFIDTPLTKPYATLGACMQTGSMLLRLATVHEVKLICDQTVFGQLDAQYFESRPIEIISADVFSEKTTAYEVTQTGKRGGSTGIVSERSRTALAQWLVLFEDYRSGQAEDATLKLAEYEAQYGPTPSSRRLARVLRRSTYPCTFATLEGDEGDLDALCGMGIA